MNNCSSLEDGILNNHKIRVKMVQINVVRVIFSVLSNNLGDNHVERT